MSGSNYTTTPNLGLFKPVFNADVGNWGGHWNTNADTLDTRFGTGGANGPWLPLAGGNMTGALNVTATGGSVARSVQDRFADVIDVRDYGARCDGTTDDTAAIQAALNAVPAQGATVFVPRMAALSNSVYVKSNTRLVGGGPGTGFIALAAASVPLALIYNQNHTATTLTDHDITVADMTLDYGGAASQGASALCVMQSVRNVRIINVTGQCRANCGNFLSFLGCYNTLAQGCSGYNFLNCAYDHWQGPARGRVIGCYAETASSAQIVNFNPEQANGPVTTTATDFILANCELVTTGTTATPIQIEPLGTGTSLADALIANNILRNCCLYIRGAVRGVSVLGNAFVSVAGGQSAISSYAQNGGTPTDVIVEGNNITDPATVSGNVAVLRCEVTAGVVANNRISGTLSTGPISVGTGAVQVIGNSYSSGAISGSGAIGYYSLSGGVVSGIVTATPTGNAPSFVIGGNLSGSYPSGGYGSLGFNFSAGAGEINFFNHFISAGNSFQWLQMTGASSANGIMTLSSTGRLSVAQSVGFWGSTPVAAKPVVSGAKGGNAALGSLMTALASYGLVTDSTTA